MSFGNKKQEDVTSSKTIIFVIFLSLLLCLAAILIWIRAIGNKREKAVEALKSTITTTNTNTTVSTPFVSMSEEDLSVESVPVSEKPAKQTVSIAKSSETSATKETSKTAPSVAQAVTSADKSYFSSVEKVVFEKYTVKEKDTLASIAESRHLRTQTLISVNSLKTVYPAVGSVLLIPNQDGQFYTVQEGDTFFSIAQRFSLSISWKTLKEINGLDDENIRVGMLLFIPYDIPVKSNAAGTAAIEVCDFIVPVFDGYVFGKFDQKVQDPLTGESIFLDGILLQTISSAVIRVSEEGFVVDKGVNESNKTWFIKVSHSNGYTTYYDYLTSVSVDIGQQINKGEIIGQIKESNTKLGIPTLFFRVEQDGISLDPSLFF